MNHRLSAPASPRVLAVKLGALGDLILADGALRDLRTQYADRPLHLLVRPAYASLMRQCPWIDAVLVDANAPRWQLPAMHRWRNAYRAGAYSHVYDLQNSRRTTFYRRWLADPPGIWSYTPWMQWKHSELSVPERLAAQLARAGIQTRYARDPQPLWMASDPSALLGEFGLSGIPFVVLLPGASKRHGEKRWPHYAALSHRLQGLGIIPVTVPGPDEAEIGADFAGIVMRLGERPLNLHELAGMLRAAACVVGNDSGPTHLAASLGAQCIALFLAGSTAIRATGIEQRHATVLTAQSLPALAVDVVIDAVLARYQGQLSNSFGLIQAH